MPLFTQNIIEDEGLTYIELKSPDKTSKALLCLNQGGRLCELELKGFQILSLFNPSEYQNNYASAILFPFPNRIKNGTYTFNGRKYNLHCNEVGRQNALHGLVYNKTFDVKKCDLNLKAAEIVLEYSDNKTAEGFPFSYKIELTYTLSEAHLNLSVKVTNTGNEAFPFALGWHPYFNSSDLDKSRIQFEVDSRFNFDSDQIPTTKTPYNDDMPLKLKDHKLDDGFVLKSNSVIFCTPDYDMVMTMSAQNNCLQLYTPKSKNSLAIEPMTGAVDCFNNKIGLQILGANEFYDVDWNLNVIQKQNIRIN